MKSKTISKNNSHKKQKMILCVCNNSINESNDNDDGKGNENNENNNANILIAILCIKSTIKSKALMWHKVRLNNLILSKI